MPNTGRLALDVRLGGGIEDVEPPVGGLPAVLPYRVADNLCLRPAFHVGEPREVIDVAALEVDAGLSPCCSSPGSPRFWPGGPGH
jgi:hypothetical protein